jgi:serine/threonine protein kinase
VFCRFPARKTIGRYEICSQLGAGGMGEVYLANDTKLDRKVALKILPSEVVDCEVSQCKRSRAPFHSGSKSGFRTQSPKHPDHLRNRRD